MIAEEAESALTACDQSRATVPPPDDFHIVRCNPIVYVVCSKTEYRQSHPSQRDPGPISEMCSFDQAGLWSTNGKQRGQPASTVQTATPSLNLPPLRSIDPLRQFASYLPPGPELSACRPSLGLPPIVRDPSQLAGLPQYSGVPPRSHLGSSREAEAPVMQMDLLPHASHVRVAPSESHHLTSTERNKREVKRRTKTGCRTCRKRRIKVCYQSLGLNP